MLPVLLNFKVQEKKQTKKQTNQKNTEMKSSITKKAPVASHSRTPVPFLCVSLVFTARPLLGNSRSPRTLPQCVTGSAEIRHFF